MNLESDRRANRRVWWVLAALFGVVFGGAVGFHLLYDVSAPDPASYSYDFKESASGENAFSVFERDTDTIRNAMREDWTKLIAENDRLHLFEPGCEEALREHVEKHREFVERFQLLVREAKRPLAYPGVNVELTLMTPMKALNVIQDGASGWQRVIQLSALTGDTFGASGQAVELTEFAKELSECDSTLIHWLVMMTVQTMGLKGLEKALQKGPIAKEVGVEYRQRLVAAELTHKDMAKCVRMEIHLQSKTWERVRLAKGRAQRAALWNALGDYRPWFAAMTFKPNMTILENVRLVTPVAQRLEESWAEGMTAAQDAERLAKAMSDRGNWKNWLNPNLLGRWLIASSLGAYDTIIDKTMQTVVLNRCLQCVLGLRAFEMEEGRLPESLDVLVPKYLPAVPEDPLTGTALKWNLQTDRIYSVGGDGRDDGGDFDPSRNMRSQKDWGIVYPRL